MLGAPPQAGAQLKGHYVPGFTGLQNGSQGPPAITVVLPVFFYTTDMLKDDEGNTLGAHPRINSTFIGPGVVWVTKVKLLGGNLGGQVLPLAFMKARIEGPSLDVPGSFNFSDIYVQPIQLGWEKLRADFVAGWGFFVPAGKWEPGGDDNGGNGRLPSDQGFDEWYGIPRTTDEALWPAAPGFSPAVMPPEQIMEGRRGERSRELKVYDVAERRLIDDEITRRTIGFMERQAAAKRPFFAYATLTQPHLPTLPNPAFAGKTGHGDWADMLAELDFNAGRMLDAVDRLGLRDSTIVIFASDNGPEFMRPYDGWAGPWRGQYFTAWEGGIRVPFMIRWPGSVPAGRVSDEIVHGVDLFPTLAALAGARVLDDRPIDGVNQSDFFLGRTEKSAREAVPIWCADRLQAVKWRNFKVHFYQQDTMVSPPLKPGIPLLFNLYANPREDARPLPPAGNSALRATSPAARPSPAARG